MNSTETLETVYIQVTDFREVETSFRYPSHLPEYVIDAAKEMIYQDAPSQAKIKIKRVAESTHSTLIYNNDSTYSFELPIS